MHQDLTAGRYPWVVLTTLSVKTLDDAKWVAEARAGKRYQDAMHREYTTETVRC